MRGGPLGAGLTLAVLGFAAAATGARPVARSLGEDLLDIRRCPALAEQLPHKPHWPIDVVEELVIAGAEARSRPPTGLVRLGPSRRMEVPITSPRPTHTQHSPHRQPQRFSFPAPGRLAPTWAVTKEQRVIVIYEGAPEVKSAGRDFSGGTAPWKGTDLEGGRVDVLSLLWPRGPGQSSPAAGRP
jgi:hypothetical protein